MSSSSNKDDGSVTTTRNAKRDNSLDDNGMDGEGEEVATQFLAKHGEIERETLMQGSV